MEKEKTEYLVIKLRSGDEIVGKKNGTKKGYVLLHRPLQIQRSTLLDPNSGQIKRNICVFRDWLEFSTENECEIPQDWIGFVGGASTDLSTRYTNELKIIDSGERTPPPQAKAKGMSIQDVLQNMPKGPQPDSPADLLRMIQMLGQPGERTASDMVTAKFTIPPDVFLSIVLNMPMFDSWGQEMPEDDEGDSDDDEGEDPLKKPKPPQNGPKKKPKPDQGDEPPSGWNGRFGFNK